MTKRKKVFYPVAKTATRRRLPAGSDESPVRPNLASIDLTAGAGRAGLAVGDRVLIRGSGQLSGEVAVIERFIGGPIPAAVVRTESGNSRHARTVDLEPVRERTENG